MRGLKVRVKQRVKAYRRAKEMLLEALEELKAICSKESCDGDYFKDCVKCWVYKCERMVREELGELKGL